MSGRRDGRGARLIAATLWYGTRKRAGDVLDSRRDSVRWANDDDEQAFDIVGPGLPRTRVVFRLDAVTAAIGATTTEVQIGPRGIRRSTYWSGVTYGGATYRLVQRGRRLAELERNGDTVALLVRPRRGSRSVNWAMAAVTDEEIALGHALAVCAGIGSPGTLANLAGVLPF